MAVTSALADPMLASGWKKTRISPTPASDCDSMCSMLLTVVVIARSEMVTMRPSTSFGESPVNCQMTEMTGMLISGRCRSASGDGEHAADGDRASPSR